MKVINQLVVALSLAVPLSLVTADELVIKNNINTFKPGTGDYTPDMREALKISPAGFENIVVVPPGYDKHSVTDADIANNGNRLQKVNLPLEGEIAVTTQALIP